jgi:predicted nucleotidyltransferase component of viral defense system
VIPRAYIVEWAQRVEWRSDDQVEQDLVLSRLLTEIAGDPYLGDELVFRGGTCLHKLHTPMPARYSEDLDYVRRTTGGIGQITRAVCDIGERMGMRPNTRMTQHPKIYLRAPFESGNGIMRIKIEVNPFERAAGPLVRLPFAVESQWFTRDADVQTSPIADLVATKLRALFQRSKGRDLFDLWLAVTQLGVAPRDLVECFAPYRPEGYGRRRAEQNLRAKLASPDFRSDLVPLVTSWPAGYDIDAAAELLIAEVFVRL